MTVTELETLLINHWDKVIIRFNKYPNNRIQIHGYERYDEYIAYPNKYKRKLFKFSVYSINNSTNTHYVTPRSFVHTLVQILETDEKDMQGFTIEWKLGYKIDLL